MDFSSFVLAAFSKMFGIKLPGKTRVIILEAGESVEAKIGTPYRGQSCGFAKLRTLRGPEPVVLFSKDNGFVVTKTVSVRAEPGTVFIRSGCDVNGENYWSILYYCPLPGEWTGEMEALRGLQGFVEAHEEWVETQRLRVQQARWAAEARLRAEEKFNTRALKRPRMFMERVPPLPRPEVRPFR